MSERKSGWNELRATIQRAHDNESGLEWVSEDSALNLDNLTTDLLAALPATPPASDPLSPQWEDCKVCGGDHWTADHHQFCDPRATPPASEAGPTGRFVPHPRLTTATPPASETVEAARHDLDAAAALGINYIEARDAFEAAIRADSDKRVADLEQRLADCITAGTGPAFDALRAALYDAPEDRP